MSSRIISKLLFVTMIAVVSFIACDQTASQPPVVYEEGKQPVTRADALIEDLHGVQVADPYRWLEDQDSSDTRTWIDAQNAYTDFMLKDIAGRDELKEKFTKLMKTDSIGMPLVRNNRLFYSKRLADQDLTVIYMREGFDGEETVLVDPHTMSEDHTTSVRIISISNDGTVLAYSVREGGVDETEIHFLNVDSGEKLDDVIPLGRHYDAIVKNDLSGVYYNNHSKSSGPRIYYHQFGDDFSNDTEVFGDGYGPQFLIYVSLSEDQDWMIATVVDGSSGPTQLYLKNVAEDSDWIEMINDGTSHSYAEFAGENVIIQTDKDAPNNKLMKAELINPAFENWTEILPEREKAVLEGGTTAGNYYIASYLEDVKSKAEVVDINGKIIREINFDTIGSFSISGNWGDDNAFISFSSFHIPRTIYSYNVRTAEQKEWESVDVPINSDDFELKQVFCESKDGTKVPMFLLYKKGLELNGNNPTLLNGYGGFNVTLTPYFNSYACVFADMGGVYAVANLRGGGEYGEEWHLAGMRENKQNVFDDFYAAANWLIDNNYTSSENLGISGGSNGGLLVGAAMTQHPELFSAVICSYPLLDMVRYHKFLVASFWIPEYGNADNTEDFDFIYEYSPYHNVKEGTDYPATLFITGDGDTRVAPLHARKMTALVQEKNGGDSPILLRYHTKAGHSGGMPVSERIDNAVETALFLKWQLFNK